MQEEVSTVGILDEAESGSTSKKPSRRDDELWKGILEDVFEDFLRFFFPDADELFDLKKKFSFMDKEFNRLFPPEENTAGVRHVDKLVKVYLKDGQQKFILVHVEVQGQKSAEDLGLRMFEEEVEQLTGRTRPMGVKEILLERREREGIEKGKEEERTKALDEKKAIARNLRNKNIDLQIIAEATNLSIEEVKAL
jgi:hypothetical protein